ncbi:hypothetical protein SacxiDRAFT_2516 [Saccharomonospora xinjiangensis XJ-54]|uniref:Uncharacterized protein n=1 Tax=Saccharomonospora xinjiangensis XJ-54 TaxID=882086 RepID=I0V3N5_9PSEU|nr:hypothetical protein SacxiDRAFT_2516 [Saccharomonospora xinjiangensis XJ-54]
MRRESRRFGASSLHHGTRTNRSGPATSLPGRRSRDRLSTLLDRSRSTRSVLPNDSRGRTRSVRNRNLTTRSAMVRRALPSVRTRISPTSGTSGTSPSSRGKRSISRRAIPGRGNRLPGGRRDSRTPRRHSRDRAACRLREGRRGRSGSSRDSRTRESSSPSTPVRGPTPALSRRFARRSVPLDLRREPRRTGSRAAGSTSAGNRRGAGPRTERTR